MTKPPPSSPPFDEALTKSLTAGWERMVWLLFKGPGANLQTWLKWGLIVMVAGAGPGGPGFNGGFNWGGGSGSSDSGDWDSTFGLAQSNWGSVEFAGIAGVVCLALVIGLALGFVVSCFRFVLLEGVLRGEPRIRPVFPATITPGLQYFLLQLAVVLGIVLMIGLAALIGFGASWQGMDDDVVPIVALGCCCGIFPIVFLLVLFQWFVNDFAIPLTWQRGSGLLDGMQHGMTLVMANPLAVAFYAVVRLVVAVAAAIAASVLLICTCFVWILPLGLIVGLIALSTASPWLLIVTAPLIVLCALVMAWIASTITAPIPIFVRAWSYAFVQQLDPSIGGWDDPNAVELGPDPFGLEQAPGSPPAADDSSNPPPAPGSPL